MLRAPLRPVAVAHEGAGPQGSAELDRGDVAVAAVGLLASVLRLAVVGDAEDPELAVASVARKIQPIATETIDVAPGDVGRPVLFPDRPLGQAQGRRRRLRVQESIRRFPRPRLAPL